MANAKKGEVVVTLGKGDAAKEYTLVFDMNALAELEELSGLTVPEVFERIAGSGQFGIRFVRAALTAGLQKRHRNMTELRVGDLMDEGRFREYGTAVAKGIVGGMGYGDEPEDKPAGEEKPA